MLRRQARVVAPIKLGPGNSPAFAPNRPCAKWSPAEPAAEAAQADASLNAALDAEEEVAAREERDRHEWHLQIRMAPARLRGGTEWMWAEERKRAQRAREAGV